MLFRSTQCILENNTVRRTFTIINPVDDSESIGTAAAYYNDNSITVTWNLDSGWCVKQTNLFVGSTGGQSFDNYDEGCTNRGTRTVPAVSPSIEEFAISFIVEQSAVLPIGRNLKGNFMVRYPGSPDTRPDDNDPDHRSYFDAVFIDEPGTPENPWVVNANCVDLNTAITTNKKYYNGKVLSFLDSELPIPNEHVPNMHWLANQDLSGELYDTFPTATFIDIQQAYWILIHGVSEVENSHQTLTSVARDIADAALQPENDDYRTDINGWDSVVIEIQDGDVQSIIVHIPELISKIGRASCRERV